MNTTSPHPAPAPEDASADDVTTIVASPEPFPTTPLSLNHDPVPLVISYPDWLASVKARREQALRNPEPMREAQEYWANHCYAEGWTVSEFLNVFVL